ncbi:hypothetical protein H6G81_09685 [Scytonema hofmannii FACHB-248]|uniref:Uncharacterized protein n=1 Tax=Scytonema hofmannii FACHB-248 TaxID=1842502 RepID=A0ABR8GMZ4_9CYAN|nr:MULTISPECIES: hypothetical protein [Nostocales]MBD2604789.1 hypothetical protein [Scytonema hofmannii FACHB-248]
MPTTNKEREIRIAQRRVEGFAQQFGEAHRNLARHAAFPLVLTPDLLYQIWANFVPEAPWTAVAHVLLSRLCRQVGYEMYEMDIADRNLLLRELKEQFGQKRFDELGEFLLDYVAQRLTDDDADTRDLREAQEWTALAYTKPSEAARELAQRLSEIVQQEDMGEVLRLASLVETLAEPLVEAGFEPLLVYSRGMGSFARGDLDDANIQFDKLLHNDSLVEIAEGNIEKQKTSEQDRDNTLQQKVSWFQESRNRNALKRPIDLPGFSDMRIIGDLASGKTSFMAALAYCPNLNSNSPIESVDPFADDAAILIRLAEDILENGISFPASRVEQDVNMLPLYSLIIQLKPSLRTHPLAAITGRSIRLQASFREYPGELIQNLMEETKDNTVDEYLEDCATANALLFLIDANSTRDIKYARAFRRLCYELAERMSYAQRDLSRFRIAIVFSKFEQPEIWIHRDNLENFLSTRFPKTRAAFQKWNKDWGCSTAYFACSAFGIVGNPPQANVKLVSRTERGINAIIAEPKAWKPFGIFAPIYWLHTGKDDPRLREI